MRLASAKPSQYHLHATNFVRIYSCSAAVSLPLPQYDLTGLQRRRVDHDRDFVGVGRDLKAKLPSPRSMVLSWNATLGGAIAEPACSGHDREHEINSFENAGFFTFSASCADDKVFTSYSHCVVMLKA